MEHRDGAEERVEEEQELRADITNDEVTWTGVPTGMVAIAEAMQEVGEIDKVPTSVDEIASSPRVRSQLMRSMAG